MRGSFGQREGDLGWALVAAGLTTVVAGVDVALGGSAILVGAFVVGPLLAAGRSGPRETAAVGIYAAALALVAGGWNGDFFDHDHIGRLPGVLIGSGLSVWIANLRRRRERVNAHLSAQNALGRTLIESETLAEAAPRILAAVGKTLDWQLGALWQLDQHTHVLRCIDVWRAPGTDAAGFLGLSRRLKLAPGEGLPGRVSKHGRPLWMSDIRLEASLPRTDVAVEAGMRAAFAFPILAEDGPVGAVEFYAREIRAPNPELLDVVGAFGSQIGQFVDRKQAELAARESEALKTSIFDTALDAVISIDASGRVVEFNPAAEGMFDYTREQALGRDMATLIIPEPLRDAHRGALERLAGGGEPRLFGQRLELTGMRRDGSELPVELTLTESGNGGRTLFTGYIRDISDRKQVERERAALLVREREARREAQAAEARSSFVAEVGTVLDGALDYEQALQELARVAVPRLGDWCVIDVVEEDGSLGRYAAVHADPAHAEEMTLLKQRYPADPAADEGLPRAIRTGESQLLERVDEEGLREIAQDSEHERILRKLGFRSALIVPLRARGRILGAVGLAFGSGSERSYGPDDLAHAEDLARRAALALDNSRLLTQSLRAEDELRRSKDQLDFILSGVADGVTAQAPDGSLLYANDAAVAVLGYDSQQELLATPPAEIMTRFEIFAEDGRPFPTQQLPGRIALAGTNPPDAVVRFRKKATGEERWSVVKATPIFDQSGRVLMAINVFEDITEHKQSELRARFLADAAAVLVSSLEYEANLQQVVELAIADFADGCKVELTDAEGQLELVTLAHRRPELVEHLRELEPRGDASPESLLVAAMSTGGKRLGTISFWLSDSDRRYDSRDRALAEELARRAAVAIDNARLYRERSYIARTLQESLLPPELPEVPGAEVAARFHAAGEATEVGGDFYDLFDTPHGWGIVMGDVCGKGADAAAVTALARYTLRTLGMQQSSPSAVLSRLNEALLRQRGDRRFCTVAYASLHVNGRGQADVDLASGGHPLPFVLRAGGKVEAVGRPGTLLGVLPDVRLHDTRVTLDRGDLLLLYTDGVTEARSGDGMLGSDQLAALLASCAGMDAKSVATRIESAALDIQKGNPRDDIAILAVRIC